MAGSQLRKVHGPFARSRTREQPLALNVATAVNSSPHYARSAPFAIESPLGHAELEGGPQPRIMVAPSTPLTNVGRETIRRNKKLERKQTKRE